MQPESRPRPIPMTSRRLSLRAPSSPPAVDDFVYHPHQEAGPSTSPIRSRLLDTLATTSKAASKWRQSIEHDLFDPPPVTHISPFANAEQLAGSRIAPSGAPGFVPIESHRTPEAKVDSVTLAGASSCLTVSLADQLRRHLPPRQRLSPTWRLLYSVDQHGASLNTLYHNTANTPSSVGNLVIVMDSRGQRFGAYINEAIRKREGQYYGTGEA